MAHSPGHRKWPDHHVLEEHMDERVEVVFNGFKVADSRDVVRVSEDDHPPRYYFPRRDVSMEALSRTETVTQCPFKGTANYYSLTVGGWTVRDAVWTYEHPYDEHEGLRERLAFDEEAVDRISIDA